jgi:hypothetical protein
MLNLNRYGLGSAVGKRHVRLSGIVCALGSTPVELSLALAVVAAVFAGSVLQANFGGSASDWYIYHTGWFIGLSAMLAISTACAIYARWPWKRGQIGWITVRLGLLLFLLGAMRNCWSGVDGQIILREDEATDQFTLNERYQITASWANRSQEPPYVFSFESGPVDWKAGAQLDLGLVDGMRARVLKYYRRSRIVETWCADDRRLGGPLLRFRLIGAGGSEVAHFLTDQDFGAELFVGPLAVRLQRAANDAMLADFLHPAEEVLGEKGVLTMYFEDDVKRVRIDEHVGKSIALGDSGATVELVQYLTDARLDRTGKFQPISDRPRNPLVELRVHLPNERMPFRQVAFAKSPLLNLDGVYDRTCPVKFNYQHPTMTPSDALEFMQAKDGKLYARTTAGTERTQNGEAATGTRIEVPGGFTFVIDEFLPHARCHISYQPARGDADSMGAFEPAVEVETSVAGTTESLWLRRNHTSPAQQQIDTPEGPLRLEFGNEPRPLGFTFQLVDCSGDSNSPARSTCESLVRLVDEASKVDAQRQISKRNPLVHNGLNVVPSEFYDAGHGREAAVFRVVHRPGGRLKSLGAWTMLLGVAVMLCMRAVSSRDSLPVRQGEDRESVTATTQPVAGGPLGRG